MVEVIRNKWCDDLEEMLQCPICMVRPPAWIYQCVQGHHICEDCKSQLMTCPTCRQRWSSARNRLAEQLCSKLNDIKLSLIDPESEINKLLIPDRVSIGVQTGLEVAATGSPAEKVVDGHTGTYPCRVGRCKTNLNYQPMMEHLKSEHSTEYVELQLGEDNIFKNIWFFEFAELMMFDRVFVVPTMGTFFLRLSSDCFGNISGFILMLHNGYHAKQYSYQLEIECCREHNTCKTYTSEVCSCRTPSTVLNEKCLEIKRVDVQKMLEHKKILSCTVLLGKKPKVEGQALPNNPKKKYPNKNRGPPRPHNQNAQSGPSHGPRPFMNRQQRPQTPQTPQTSQTNQEQQGRQPNYPPPLFGRVPSEPNPQHRQNNNRNQLPRTGSISALFYT